MKISYDPEVDALSPAPAGFREMLQPFNDSPFQRITRLLPEFSMRKSVSAERKPCVASSLKASGPELSE